MKTIYILQQNPYNQTSPLTILALQGRVELLRNITNNEEHKKKEHEKSL